MLERILLPLDGSQLAESALPHAVTCAQATGSRLTLVNVLQTSDIHIDIPSVDPLDWRLRKMEAKLYLEEMAERLSAEGVRVETVLLQGEAAESITQLAKEKEADLIVMASHGRSGLNGWNLSSTVQKVILATHTSVMVVPAYRAGGVDLDVDLSALRYRTIVAPLDGSRRAECVLPFVSALAQQNRAPLRLVTVVARPEMPQRAPLLPDDRSLADQLVARKHGEAKKYLEQLESRIDGDVSHQLLVGDDVIDTLHDFIRQQEADLVVFSAHGHSGNGARRYGSLVTSFIAYVSTPLLIIQDLPPSEIMKSEAQIAAEAMFERPMEVRAVVNTSAAA